MHLALWYGVLVCHQYVLVKIMLAVYMLVGMVGLSESRFCVFRGLCPVDFVVVSSHVVY